MRGAHCAMGACLAFGYACGSGEQFIPAPEIPGAQSVAFAAGTGEGLRVELHPAEGDWAFRADEEQIVVLAYRDSLEAVGFQEGALPEDFDGSCGLSQPASVFALDRRALGWAPAELQGELKRFLEGDQICFACKNVSLLSRLAVPFRRTKVQLALPLESGAMLSALGRGFAAGGDAPSLVRSDYESADLLIGCDETEYRAGAAIGGNRFWVGGEGGRLDRVTIDEASGTCAIETSTRAPDLPTPTTPINRLLLDSDNALYVALSDGRLLHYDGSAFEEILSLSPHPSAKTELDDFASLVRSGPDSIAYAAGWDRVGRYSKSDGVRIQRVLLNENGTDSRGYDRVTALGYVDGIGLLAGGPNGEIYNLDIAPNGKSLGKPIVPDDVGSIVDVGGGFIATIEGGRVLQWSAHREFCAESFELAGARGEPGRSTGIVNGKLFVGDFARTDAEAAVVWLNLRD